MSGGSKHKPVEVAAEALAKSMNFEPTCETPALRKSVRLGILAGGGEVYHRAYWAMFLPKCKTKLICRAKGLEQEKNISPYIQGPVYNQQ